AAVSTQAPACGRYLLDRSVPACRPWDSSKRILTIQSKRQTNSDGARFLNRKLVAFTLPVAAYLILLAVDKTIQAIRPVNGAFWLDSPEYWIYPAQTISCGALLIRFWREYEFRAARQIIFSAAVALLAFAVWISPQVLL